MVAMEWKEGKMGSLKNKKLQEKSVRYWLWDILQIVNSIDMYNQND